MMDNIKISFICDWGMSSEYFYERARRLTPGNSNRWKNLVATKDIKEADFIVALGNFPYSHTDGEYIKTHAEKLIHVRTEATAVCGNWHGFNDKSYTFDFLKGHRCNTVDMGWVFGDYDSYVSSEYPNKPKDTSIIASTIWDHRTDYIKAIQEFTGNSIDLYGRGWESQSDSLIHNYKGELPKKDDKPMGLTDYKFSVAIENSAEKNYVTEKLYNCFMEWTIPLYWGCPNISDFYPEDSYRLLDLNDPSQILDVIKEPVSDREKEALREARHLVLNKHNIWEIVWDIINNKIKTDI